MRCKRIESFEYGIFLLEKSDMLKIENLTKKFGDKVAVDNLSLEIKQGELCAFIGPNGSGKTTTLKCIVGIIEPENGKISIDGVDNKEQRIEFKKNIAYVPDNPDIYEFMSGKEYLKFVSDIFGVSEDERNLQIQKYAKVFEIEEVLSNVISSYSHGMKQKLVILSALIHSPKFILFDEPFVGLDPRASHALKTIMKEFCKKGGAIFFSTHVLEVAEKLCDTVAIIKEGQLIKRGKMSDVMGDKSLEQLFLETV